MVPTSRTWKSKGMYQPTENLCPGCDAAVVTCASSHGPSQLCTMRWGLVPSFDKAANPDHWKMFNARSETCDTLPVFKRLLKDRRCAVPFDGFFEWTDDEMKRGGKQPFYVKRRSGEPLWIAGLHDSVGTSDDTLRTFTLITRAVDPKLAWLHDRMPVILNAAGLLAWLAPHVEAEAGGNAAKAASVSPTLDALRSLLPVAEVEWHPTSKKMSRLDYQAEDCARSVRLPSQQQPSVASLFGKRPAIVPINPIKAPDATEPPPQPVKLTLSPKVEDGAELIPTPLPKADGGSAAPASGSAARNCPACTFLCEDAARTRCEICGTSLVAPPAPPLMPAATTVTVCTAALSAGDAAGATANAKARAKRRSPSGAGGAVGGSGITKFFKRETPG
jgi:putative SOS response-associated peptidase YedK